MIDYCPTHVRYAGSPPRSRRPRPILRGMTLFELVVVAAILAILAAIVVPRFGASITWRRVEGAARRIASDLNLAQRRASQTSTSQTLAFNTTTHSYRIVGLPDPVRPGSEYVVLLREPPYEVKIVSIDLGGDANLVFDGFGTPDSGGTIVLRSGDYRATVTVDSATGQASYTTSINTAPEAVETPTTLPS